MRKAKDMLLEKKIQLGKFANTFDSTVQLVRNTLNRLEDLNNDIEDSISDIEAYQRGLQETKESMVEEKQRNARIICNFKTLLCEDEEAENEPSSET